MAHVMVRVCQLCGVPFRPRSESDSFCCGGCRAVYGLVGGQSSRPLGSSEALGSRFALAATFSLVATVLSLPGYLDKWGAFALQEIFQLLSILAALLAFGVAASWVYIRALGALGRRQMSSELAFAGLLDLLLVSAIVSLFLSEVYLPGFDILALASTLSLFPYWLKSVIASGRKRSARASSSS